MTTILRIVEPMGERKSGFRVFGSAIGPPGLPGKDGQPGLGVDSASPEFAAAVTHIAESIVEEKASEETIFDGGDY